MRYEIEAAGRLRRVSVSRTGDGFAVSVDERLLRTDIVRIDSHTLSLIVDSSIAAGLFGPRRVYDATVVPEAGTGRLIVLLGGVPVAVTLNGRRGGRSEPSGASSGPLRITAPMPGKVVRVLVEPGQPVRARQPVVVVEAMKMENALRTDRDGTVTGVHAREGTSVEAGALLVVIQ